MELYFLGTGAGMPSRRRNVTAIVLHLLEELGESWLFDCGEGTQHQVLASPVKLSRLTRLFVTHLHGDHIYGLPGLLTSRSYQGGESPLRIYGPPGIKAFILSALELSQARLSYELHIEEIEADGLVFEDDTFRVEAAHMEHRIECLGYRVIEKDKEGRLDADKLREWGIPPGPVYGTLKKGGTVSLPDGRILNGRELLGPSIPGRVVTILGDTRPTVEGIMLAKDADVLVHEATFGADKADLASQFFHSTTKEAAGTAAAAGAKRLLLTHISSRYSETDAEALKSEASELFPEVEIAEDFSSFLIPPRKPVAPLSDQSGVH